MELVRPWPPTWGTGCVNGLKKKKNQQAQGFVSQWFHLESVILIVGVFVI